MSIRTAKFWEPLIAAIVGAALLVAITFILDPDFSKATAPKLLSSLVVGAIVGWMYDLLRETRRQWYGIFREAEALALHLKYQDAALAMLAECPQHGFVLSELISESLREKFRNIPYVDEVRYLTYLNHALDHSSTFQGVQRTPVRRLLRGSALAYMQRLQHRSMRLKRRLFIIEPEDIAEMREDLANEDTMREYWSLSRGVQSYWIPRTEFEHQFPTLGVPRDFALYDDRLLISYDPEHHVLSFDILTDSVVESRALAKLTEQLSEQGAGPFTELVPPAGEAKRSSRVVVSS